MDPQVGHGSIFLTKMTPLHIKKKKKKIALTARHRARRRLCAGEAGCPDVCDHWGCSHGHPGHGRQRGGGRMLEGAAGTF